MKTGVIALCGVPGSGKTLNAVHIALDHYKKENSFLIKGFAFLKYKIYKIFHIELLKEKVKANKIYIMWQKSFICETLKSILKCIPLLPSIYQRLSSINWKYYQMFPKNKINNVYSTFPICLDKKNKVFTNMISLYDLQGQYSFIPNALIITDEVQLFVDSDEYKDKEKNKIISRIAKFLQAHRHFGVKQIIFTTQNPSRLFKKARNVTVWYIKQKKIINIPFTPFSIMRGIAYEDIDFYGKHIPKDKDERRKLAFEYRKFTKFFLRSTLYNAYDSRYLSVYNFERPLLERGCWNDFKVSYDYVSNLFEDNVF